jgi:LPXTG-motif cell wall-anchored protein
VTYPVVAGGSTGAQPVSMAVTNTGATWLSDINIADSTLNGPDITGLTCDFTPVGGPASGVTWAGPWEPGTTFYCSGELELSEADGLDAHGDLITVDATVVRPEANPDYDPENPDSKPFTNNPMLDDDGQPVRSNITVTDDDPYHANVGVAGVSISKGDGDGASGVITNEADNSAAGAVYTAEQPTRDIVMVLENTGEVPLYNVTVTDQTTGGEAPIESLSCQFPGTTEKTEGQFAGGRWAVPWFKTFEVANGVGWEPGVSFVCVATLTLGLSDVPHRDLAGVSTSLTPIGNPLDPNNLPPGNPNGPSGDDPYVAFTGGIQVIKYDGTGSDPAVKDPNGSIIPSKPLSSSAKDANDAATAVSYKGGPRPIRWVVTNTGMTWLTDVVIEDITGNGPAIDPASISCEFPDGTTGEVVDGKVRWENPAGVLFAPGASFFCEGILDLAPGETHDDVVKATATIVAPEEDGNGGFTGNPLLDADGQPVRADGQVADDDPFYAMVPMPVPPVVEPPVVEPPVVEPPVPPAGEEGIEETVVPPAPVAPVPPSEGAPVPPADVTPNEVAPVPPKAGTPVPPKAGTPAPPSEATPVSPRAVTPAQGQAQPSSAPVGAAPGALPRTGSETAGMILVGLMLLVGGVLVLRSRRRNQSSNA